MSAQPTAKARKRAAVAEVRELAASLGVTVSREKTDLKEPEFAALQREVRGPGVSGNLLGHAFLDSGNLRDL